jgi:hypothetical protein
MCFVSVLVSTIFVRCKRPTRPKASDKYVPCTVCFGFFAKCELWKHVKNCRKKHGAQNQVRRNVVSAGMLLLHTAPGAGEGLKKYVLSLGQHDTVIL